MAERKYSKEEVRDIVENEGLGYAIQWYMSAAYVEDEDVAFHWAEAKKHLDAIDKLLKIEE
jgi:hypothetical protein